MEPGGRVSTDIPERVLEGVRLDSLVARFPIRAIVVRVAPEGGGIKVVSVECTSTIFIAGDISLPVNERPCGSTLHLLYECRWVHAI